MNAWKIVCATLVIFIAGIVTGVVLVRLGERGAKPWARLGHEAVNRHQAHLAVTNVPVAQNPKRPGNPPAGGGSGGGNVAAINREFVPLLERQLRLSAVQREQIEKIMKAAQDNIRVLREGIEPDIRKEMQKTQDQIRALLTVEQQEQYQLLMKRQQRRGEPPAPGERRMREPSEQGGPRDFREIRPPRGPLPPLDNPRAVEQPRFEPRSPEHQPPNQ